MRFMAANLSLTHFEQQHRIAARPSVIRTIQLLNQIIDAAKIHCFVDFSQQMILQDKFIHAEEFHLILISHQAIENS